MSAVNYIRDKYSPALSRFYARLGLADRQRLIQNIRSIETNDQRALLESLTRNGILKWRFHDQIDSAEELRDHMIYGRVDPGRIKGFASDQAEEPADVETVRTEMMDGVFCGKYALPSHLINLSLSLAFYAGAATAAFYGISQFGLAPMIGLGVLYPFAAKAVGRFNQSLNESDSLLRFNPYARFGRLIGLGNRLFTPTLLGTTLLTAGLLTFCLYKFIDDKLNPRYENDKIIYVTSDGPEVSATVCNEAGQDCQTRPFWRYQGAEVDRHAIETAAALQSVINDQDLYQGGFKFEDDRLIITDPWRFSWTPDFIPWGQTTVLDLSGEGPRESQRQARFAEFMENLWGSGIMPSANELARLKLRLMESRINPYRDPRLDDNLTKASLNLQLEHYDQVETNANNILESRLSVTTSRPARYDEAVFVLVDSERIQGMRFWSPEHIARAGELLLAHRAKARPLETGYHIRYNYELGKTCGIKTQFFPNVQDSLAGICKPQNVERYFHNAAFGNNRRTPLHNDNFLAVRAFLDHGRYQIEQGNFTAARQQYQRALALIDLVDSCSNATSHDVAEGWTAYSPYLTPQDLAVAGLFGHSVGLRSFALRCEISRTLRGDHLLLRELPYIGSNDQFNPELFKFFRARAEEGLAAIEVRLASRYGHDPERAEDHLLLARGHLRAAYREVEEIRNSDLFEFYTARYEERETYYSVMTNYAEVLNYLYMLRPDRYARSLPRIAAFATIVEGARAGKPPVDMLYLRARFLLAEVALAERRNRQALAIYVSILNTLNQAKQRLPEGVEAPPEFHRLEESINARLIVLRQVIGGRL